MTKPFIQPNCDHRGFLVPVMFLKHEIILSMPGMEPKRVKVDIVLKIKCVACGQDINCPPPSPLSAEELEKYPV